MIFLSAFVSLIVSLLTCLLFFYFRNRRLRRESEIEKTVKKLRIEVGEMVTALNGTTERNIALIEDRVNHLNKLIEKAGKAAGALKREQEKNETAAEIYSSLSRSRPIRIDVEETSNSADPGTTIGPTISAASAAPVDTTASAAPSGPATPTVSAAAAPGATATPVMDFESLPIREKALVLYRKGDNPDEIASRLNMSRGEIELIISLHERRL